MGLLTWIILGGLAGWISTILTKKDARFGIIGNIIIGIIGAILGGFVVNLFGGAGVTGFNLYSLIVATFGSVLLLWIVSILNRA